MQQRLITDITAHLHTLKGDALIEAINQLRQAIHAASPFQDQPIDCVMWVKGEAVTPNDYNPNNMAPPEKRLLLKSLEADGFTQPVVVMGDTGAGYEIVDGFHRQLLATSKKSLKTHLHGYLPIACIARQNGRRDARMAATIRHNRARGRHQISAMSDIVVELVRLGWDDQKNRSGAGDGQRRSAAPEAN